MKLRILFFSLIVFLVNRTFATTLQGNILSDTSIRGIVDVISQVNLGPNITLSFEEGTILYMHGGASIVGSDGSKIVFNGTVSKPIQIEAAEGKNWGKFEVNGATGHLEVHHVQSSMGQFRVMKGASAVIEDSYMHDYFQGDNPIVYTEDAGTVNISRCKFSNYYELNLVRTLAVVEDCLLQFMTADGIDFDNSPPGTILRRSTLQYGRGFNIDAIDFGKVNFTGNGSVALVEQCIVHDISDKGVSVGEGAQDVTIRGCVFYNCGAGSAVKDNSIAHIFNNTIVGCDAGIECVEKNPGLGGGHAFTYNNIIWKSHEPFFINSTGTADIQYSLIDGMTPDASRHIFYADPLFTSEALTDYHLLPGSPAIGAGLNGEDLGAIFPVGATFNQPNELVLGVPNPFSVFKGGEESAIWWASSPSVSKINIEFSSDNGDSWTSIQSNVDAKLKGIPWNIPNVYSSRCLVKLTDVSNPTITVTNVLPFSILPEVDSTGVPVFSTGSGYFDQPVDLSITAPAGATILYTTDGSDPSDKSNVYTGTIHLDYDSIPVGQPELNITASQSYHQPYSYIRTSPVWQDGPTIAFWRKPTGTVFKAHIIRARVYDPLKGLGPIKTHSYFIHPQMTTGRYTLPVVSLVTDPGNLFDYYKGIYIPGASFKDSSWTGNYEFKGRASEKPFHFEYFDEHGVKQLSQSIGVRVRGEWIRAVGQKALTLYARSEYDTENNFKYPFFSGLKKPGTNIYQTKFKRLILRNNGNEWGYYKNTMLRDAAIQSLFSGLNIGYQPYRMTVTFINGEYWGIQDIRVVPDVRGIQYAYDLEPDSIVLMEDNLSASYQLVNGNAADQQDFIDLRSFILANDLNVPANYAYVCSKMDINSFTDYWIATVFTNKNNADHNKTYWKLRTPDPTSNRYGYDGKWRWIANDFDGGFDHVIDNNLWFNITAMHDSLLRRMVTCDVFRRQWILRFADVLNSNFKASYTTNRFTEIQNLLEPEMQEHIERWSTPSSMTDWYAGVQEKRDFGMQRPAIQFGHLNDYFYLHDTANITLDVNNSLYGYVEINTLRINAALPGVSESVYPWEGTYFKDMAFTVKAIPNYGYRFVRWENAPSNEQNPVQSVILLGDKKMTAIFEWDPSVLFPNLTVFPNPATGDEVKLNNEYTYSVYDATGKLILRFENSNHFDISNFEKGIYLLRTDDGEQVKFVRL
ncbi:MAG: CotH kinase family protein [Bacteroidetes bacterium]|nr:CotH kinase family protein [Bacteroidota bacterium]